MDRDLYLDIPRLYDSKRGEVVDFFNGEVEEDHMIVSKPTIRAEDYAEWDSKRHHAVLISEKERRLYSIIWNVGEEIGAPAWLRKEVLFLYKKVPQIRIRYNISKKRLPKSVKAILATYLALAYRFELRELIEKIKLQDCGGRPCYLSKRNHDREFAKYLSSANMFVALVYGRKEREPEDIIRYYATRARFIPSHILEKAIEKAKEYWGILHTRKEVIVFIVSVVLACKEVSGNSELCTELKLQLCRKLKTYPYMVNKLLKAIEKG